VGANEAHRVEGATQTIHAHSGGSITIDWQLRIVDRGSGFPVAVQGARHGQVRQAIATTSTGIVHDPCEQKKHQKSANSPRHRSITHHVQPIPDHRAATATSDGLAKKSHRRRVPWEKNIRRQW
jgi:hypothetical protein